MIWMLSRKKNQKFQFLLVERTFLVSAQSKEFLSNQFRSKHCKHIVHLQEFPIGEHRHQRYSFVRFWLPGSIICLCYNSSRTKPLLCDPQQTEKVPAQDAANAPWSKRGNSYCLNNIHFSSASDMNNDMSIQQSKCDKLRCHTRCCRG